MHKTTEDAASVRELVSRAASFNDNIGRYQEHYLNDDFNYSVKLANGYGVKVSRMLAQDFARQPSILTDEALKKIAGSVWRIG